MRRLIQRRHFIWNAVMDTKSSRVPPPSVAGGKRFRALTAGEIAMAAQLFSDAIDYRKVRIYHRRYLRSACSPSMLRWRRTAMSTSTSRAACQIFHAAAPLRAIGSCMK